MTTLESRFSNKVAEYAQLLDGARQRVRDLESGRHGPEELERARRELAEVERGEVEYLLDSMPFIREYSSTKVVNDAPLIGGLANFVEVTHKTSKNSVLQRYLAHVEGQVDATTMAAVAAHGEEGSKRNPREAEYFCSLCQEGMDFHARESMLVCPACGACKAYTEMNGKNLTYEQEIHQDVVTYFAYKRLNHFCEWLNSLQAKVRNFLARA